MLVANYNHLTLHLHADSAAWATKLRFKTPAILEIARNHCMLSDLQNIRIKVAPPAQVKPATTAKPHRLSAKSKQLLNEAGRAIADPKLRHALMHLARNGD